MTSPRHPTTNAVRILGEVADATGISVADMRGPSQCLPIVRARFAAMYRLRHELYMSYPAIGRVMGGRHHTTVMSGVHSFARLHGLPVASRKQRRKPRAPKPCAPRPAKPRTLPQETVDTIIRRAEDIYRVLDDEIRDTRITGGRVRPARHAVIRAIRKLIPDAPQAEVARLMGCGTGTVRRALQARAGA